MSQRLLFVPASGPRGSGEYYRCLNLARAAVVEADRRGMALECHVLLHRDASVETDAALTPHAISQTPSRASAEVSDWLARLQPDLAAFDCSGRVRHFRQVRRQGGRVVWISNRPGKHRRGFSPRVLPWLNGHLLADCDPDDFRRPWLARMSPGWLGDCDYLPVRLIAPSARDPGLTLPPRFAAFVAGGGGYRHEGRPLPEILRDAADQFSRATGLPSVLVTGPQYAEAMAGSEQVTVLSDLPTRGLQWLLGRSLLAVTGAGYMLSSQVLTEALPAVMTPAGGRDQPGRIQRLCQQSLVLAADPAPEALAEAAIGLYRDEALRQALSDSIRAAGLRNSADQAAAWLLDRLPA
ncbi:MAG: hypothetical protein ACXIUB_10965 [Wenzhouxiangella sp.]